MITDTSNVVELTREQIVHALDEESERRLGIRADELVRRYKSGNLKGDCGKFADLLALASLLNEDDPLFVAA